MKDIRYIDFQKVEEIAAQGGNLKQISNDLEIKESVLIRSLYYTDFIKHKELKKQYIELAKAIRKGQLTYKLKQLE